jgi:abortive infection bacteriophage resistance protein
MPKLKSPTTYNQQLEKLRSRGCQVSDIPLCEEILSRINYYRRATALTHRDLENIKILKNF